MLKEQTIDPHEGVTLNNTLDTLFSAVSYNHSEASANAYDTKIAQALEVIEMDVISNNSLRVSSDKTAFQKILGKRNQPEALSVK